MNLAAAIGLTGISLLLSATLLRVLLFFKFNRRPAYLAAALLFTLSFLSYSDNSLTLYFRGIFNDLSITTLILLSYFFIRPGANKNQTLPVFSLIAMTGIVFYPAALGLGTIDPYQWGFINNAHGLFPSLTFLILLAGLMFFALLKNYSLLLLSLVLASLAFHAGLLESRNLWDYLFDPLIFIYALITIFRYLLTCNKD